MNSCKTFLLLSALVFTFLSSEAANKRLYGMAGCGLGNLVVQKKNQVFAATINATGSQTFGITSGTSQCTERSYQAEKDLPRFLAMNRVAFDNDLARGQGEALDVAKELLGCDAATPVEKKWTALASELIPLSTPELTERALSLAQEDPVIASRCQYL